MVAGLPPFPFSLACLALSPASTSARTDTVSILADPTPAPLARSKITRLVILSPLALSHPNRKRCPIWTSHVKRLKSVKFTDFGALEIVTVKATQLGGCQPAPYCQPEILRSGPPSWQKAGSQLRGNLPTKFAGFIGSPPNSPV